MTFLQNTNNSFKSITAFNELSLNVLDIAQNSIRAKATLVEIILEVRTDDNSLSITIKDNGLGFDLGKYEKGRKNRTYGDRRNGMGISLFRESAEITGGDFKITSQKGSGTSLTANYALDSPYRMPVGDINATVEALILCCKNTDFIYTYKVNGESFTLDTVQMKSILSDIPLQTPEVMEYIRCFLKENSDIINKNNNFLKG